jgi:hypothetical protein
VADGKRTANVSGRGNNQIASCIYRPCCARGDGNVRKFDSCITFGTKRGSRRPRDLVSLPTMVTANLTRGDLGEPAPDRGADLARVSCQPGARGRDLIVAATSATVSGNKVLRLVLNKPAVRTAEGRLARELGHQELCSNRSGLNLASLVLVRGDSGTFRT